MQIRSGSCDGSADYAAAKRLMAESDVSGDLRCLVDTRMLIDYTSPKITAVAERIPSASYVV